MERNVVGWFEIPVQEMDRAKSFYEQVFDVKLESRQMGEDELMAVFPWEGEKYGASGALVRNTKDPIEPAGNSGLTIYFNTKDITAVIDRVTTNKGKIITSPTLIPGSNSKYATFLDTEGNRIGLYAE